MALSALGGCRLLVEWATFLGKGFLRRFGLERFGKVFLDIDGHLYDGA